MSEIKTAKEWIEEYIPQEIIDKIESWENPEVLCYDLNHAWYYGPTYFEGWVTVKREIESGKYSQSIVKSPKTRRDFIETLPELIRDLFYYEVEKAGNSRHLDDEVKDLQETMRFTSTSFSWRNSILGWDFWRDIANGETPEVQMKAKDWFEIYLPPDIAKECCENLKIGMEERDFASLRDCFAVALTYEKYCELPGEYSWGKAAKFNKPFILTQQKQIVKNITCSKDLENYTVQEGDIVFGGTIEICGSKSGFCSGSAYNNLHRVLRANNLETQADSLFSIRDSSYITTTKTLEDYTNFLRWVFISLEAIEAKNPKVIQSAAGFELKYHRTGIQVGCTNITKEQFSTLCEIQKVCSSNNVSLTIDNQGILICNNGHETDEQITTEQLNQINQHLNSL